MARSREKKRKGTYVDVQFHGAVSVDRNAGSHNTNAMECLKKRDPREDAVVWIQA
jgi:hypothetical protein